MTQTTARIKQGGKHFEIIVNLEKALRFKKESGSDVDFLEADTIFTDSKKGFVASNKDLEEAFKTNDVNFITKKIVKNGEVLLNQEYRNEKRDNKVKQVIEFLSKNAVDPKTGTPHTSERIKNALDQAQINIKNDSVESQIGEIIDKLRSVLPVKLETKRIKITTPSIYTGKVYGVISQYKENEKWLDNGDLEMVVSVPSGLVMGFYDKLNSVTHGSAVTEEIKENE